MLSVHIFSVFILQLIPLWVYLFCFTCEISGKCFLFNTITEIYVYSTSMSYLQTVHYIFTTKINLKAYANWIRKLR